MSTKSLTRNQAWPEPLCRRPHAPTPVWLVTADDQCTRATEQAQLQTEWVIVQVGAGQPRTRGLPRGTALLVVMGVPHDSHMAVHPLEDQSEDTRHLVVHQREALAWLREPVMALWSWATRARSTIPRRRGDGPGHARARRRAQEATVRDLVADAVTEAHETHAAAQHDPAGSANGAGAPTLLSEMHRIVNAVQRGLISLEAALYGHWMEWRTSNRSGRPLSMGDTLRLTVAGSAMSLHSSALLHALRTRCPGDTAPYLNPARATYPGGVSEFDAALHLLHPPDEDLEVGEITVFVEGADEAPNRSRPTNLVYDGARPTPPYAVMCEAFLREPTWCPAPPPATHAPRGWANPNLSPPLSRTRGAHHRGQVVWQNRPATPLLLLVIATRGDPERVLGITPTHLYGAASVPRPPLPAPAARDGVHTFLRTQEVTAVTGVHLVRLPWAPPDDPRGPRALSPALDWELWRDVWVTWLTRLPSQCRWMATSPCPHGANVTAGPPSPPPLPPAEHCTALPTAQHRCTRR